MQVHAPFEAYRGDNPYLFVSYAHKDSAIVYPILQKLQDAGWRMWYDEGIDPGNEWAAFIETALTSCAQMLCFISTNSVESLNCRQEINLAIDDKKPVLAVHLEETELKYGLRLRMSAFQAVMKYRIESDEEFFRALDRGLVPECGSGSSASTQGIGHASIPAKVSVKRAVPSIAKIAAVAALAVLAVGIGFFAVRARTGSNVPSLVIEGQSVPEKGIASTDKDGTTGKAASTEAALSGSAAEKPAPKKAAISKGFATIEGGSFMMGSPGSEAMSDNNELLHKVSLSGFCIGKHEVTQAEWNAVMDSNPSAFKGDTLPVEGVSWYEIILYCNKRSIKEGLTPCYRVNGKSDPKKWGTVPTAKDPLWDLSECDFSASGYRLPTEAEWEYACRADTRTAFFTGANITTDQANYDGAKPYNGASAGESRKKTMPVGSFAANAYGLFDTSGNVWEWCNDWFGPYQAGLDPVGPGDGATRIVRGGSWDSGAQFARSGFRGGNAPQNKGNDLGFRLACRR